MAKCDLYSNIKYVPSIGIGVYPAGDGTTEGDGVDTQGFESVVMCVCAVETVDGAYIFRIEDSDDDVNYDAVDAQFIQGAAILLPGSDNLFLKVGYIGGRRYVRALVIYTGSQEDDASGAFFMLSDPHSAPVE